MNVRRRWRRGKPQQDQHLTGPDGSRCLRETTTRRDEECSNGRLRSECGAQARRKFRETAEARRNRRAEAARKRRGTRKDPADGWNRSRTGRRASAGKEGRRDGTKNGASTLASRKRRHGWSIDRERIPQGSGLVLRDGARSGPPMAGEERRCFGNAQPPALATDAKSACPCRRGWSMPPKPGRAIRKDHGPKSGDMGTGSDAGPLLRLRPPPATSIVLTG